MISSMCIDRCISLARINEPVPEAVSDGKRCSSNLVDPAAVAVAAAAAVKVEVVDAVLAEEMAAAAMAAMAAGEEEEGDDEGEGGDTCVGTIVGESGLGALVPTSNVGDGDGSSDGRWPSLKRRSSIPLLCAGENDEVMTDEGGDSGSMLGSVVEPSSKVNGKGLSDDVVVAAEEVEMAVDEEVVVLLLLLLVLGEDDEEEEVADAELDDSDEDDDVDGGSGRRGDEYAAPSPKRTCCSHRRKDISSIESLEALSLISMSSEVTLVMVRSFHVRFSV